jgi:hypothetical protein
MKAKQTTQKHYNPVAGLIAVAVLAILAALLVTRQANRDNSINNDAVLVNHDAAVTTTPNSDVAVPKTKNAVTVTGQKAGNSIVIDEVSLQKPGYVVIHADDKGKPGAIVARSGLVSAGTKQDLVINYAAKAGTVYYVMLHSDNGDGKFDAAKDLPIMGADAMAVMASFTTLK